MFIIKALYLKDIALFWWRWRDFFVIPIVCRRHPINILQSLLTQASLDSQTLQNLVEMAGFEPASKQGTNMLSTRLSWPSVFEQWQDPSHQPLPYPLNLILASRPAKTSPDISAPLDPISLWALAWSDVSVQHLVPKLGESTILRLRSESYSIVASYNGEPD